MNMTGQKGRPEYSEPPSASGVAKIEPCASKEMSQ